MVHRIIFRMFGLPFDQAIISGVDL
ncbi:hypothetical protein [Bacillus amyloliquefaciens]|nr:hypothetical protein [Bacillus amyloliquefaciens]